MTREEILNACLDTIGRTNCLLLESATGTGKTAISLKLVNHLSATIYKGKKLKILLLVARKVHKQTWRDEIEKWGGINAEVIMECYESLRKHVNETFDVLLADECHHIQSEARLDFLAKVNFRYFIGLSATIPRNLKSWFKWHYRAQTVLCGIVEAIEDDVLPEPEILLWPLQLDNTAYSETWEINPKAKGPIRRDNYKNIWKYVKSRTHAILECTQKQKSNEFNAECLRLKNRYNLTRNEGVRNIWLQKCGQRLEYYSYCKIPIVKEILRKLNRYRTITFCKTIDQCEQLGKNCIHSMNKDVEKVYNDFNTKKINHITAVNILNENANLVDCKYGIFCNLSSSELIMPQRLGRLLRHKKPVMIIPYYQGTREQEVVEAAFAGFNKNYIREIHSIEEI